MQVTLGRGQEGHRQHVRRSDPRGGPRARGRRRRLLRAREHVELNYDPAPDRVIALVNIGARYTSVNILKNAQSVFTHDVAVGGRDLNEALVRDLGVSPAVAESLQAGDNGGYRDSCPGGGRGRRRGRGLIRRDPSRHHLLLDRRDGRDPFTPLISLAVPLGLLACRRACASGWVPRRSGRSFARVCWIKGSTHRSCGGRAPEFAVAVGLATRRPEDK